MELDSRVEQLTKSITDLASELKSKKDMPLDRVTAIEAEIVRLDDQLQDAEAEKRANVADERLAALEDRVKAFTPAAVSQKAAAILAGAGGDSSIKAVGAFSETNFLSAIKASKEGDPDARAFVKSVLGTSNATGQSIVPNNFVADLEIIIAKRNIYRQICNVVTGVVGNGVDIPYETDDVYQADVTAFGSNKTIVDFAFGEATATFYTVAQIANIGNQLLRQSNGAAEAAARRRLGNSVATREAVLINNGTGSSQPEGILQAFLDFGDVAAFKTALNSESRAAAIARGIGALEGRGIMADTLAVVVNTTDFWEMATETLGTSGSGGWVFDPATGAAGNSVGTRFQVWGVPVYRDPLWPAAYAGTAVVGQFSECDIYLGQEVRIDVSSEANDRWDKNITGFRIEEELAFNAKPYVYTGKFQKVTGI